MVTSLKSGLESQTRLFQKVDNPISTREFATCIEPDTDEFTKARGVVIPHSLGIAPGLKHRVGLDNLVLKTRLTLLLLARGTNGGKVGDDLLCVLGLAGT